MLVGQDTNDVPKEERDTAHTAMALSLCACDVSARQIRRRLRSRILVHGLLTLLLILGVRVVSRVHGRVDDRNCTTFLVKGGDQQSDVDTDDFLLRAYTALRNNQVFCEHYWLEGDVVHRGEEKPSTDALVFVAILWHVVLGCRDSRGRLHMHQDEVEH